MNYITIQGKPYSTGGYVVKNYKITSDRLKKWREGKGVAVKHPLDFIELEGIFLYNLNDMDILKLEHVRLYGLQPQIYYKGVD